MRRKFTEIAFTPGVKTVQTQNGTREIYDNFVQQGVTEDYLTEPETEFIQARDSFYMSTVGSNNYPYIQFRGGTTGFLKIIDKKTIGFADFKGNLQYISVGNLSENDRVFLFLMDYAHRRRLKIWGRAKTTADPELLSTLTMPDYPAEIERGIIITIEAMSWNCPQHIPLKYSEAEVNAKIQPLESKIARLEAKLAELTKSSS